MEFDISNLLRPSTKVDIVFNASSLSPYSRASMIYDIDYDRHTAIIAQPVTAFTRNTLFKELHLTAIWKEKSNRTRIGVRCDKFKIIDDYSLANQKKVPAVALHFNTTPEEINIRSAFRLPQSTNYIIKGILSYQGLQYSSPADFSIKDASFTGIGLIVPKKGSLGQGAVTKLKHGDELQMDMILVHGDPDVADDILPLATQVVRINAGHSDTHLFMGLKIMDLEADAESRLNRFLHAAQVDELKRLSGRDS